MGRKAVGARVKKLCPDGSVLYAWRESPGGLERTGKGPGGEANILLFKSHVLDCWDKSIVPSAPSAVLVAATPASRTATQPSAPTVREWVGTLAKPGPFFGHANPMTQARRKKYFRECSKPCVDGLIGAMRLDQVSSADAEAVMDRAMRCESCWERSQQAGRTVSDSEMRGDRPSFDGACPDHRPHAFPKRSTASSFLATLNAVWNAAERAGLVNRNPFKDRKIGRWAEPTSEDDFRTALTIAQMYAFIDAHPEDLKVIPAISSYGMLRASEFWGLQRSDFPAPPEDPDKDPSSIVFHISRVWDRLEGRMRPWGKTDGSTGVPITLGKYAVKFLNAHLRRNHILNPACPACAAGDGLWRGTTRHNPHRGCGFANDAPLIPMQLCTPAHYTKKVCGQAQTAAGLDTLPFTIVHRSFRCTGATMLIRAGVSESEVVVMGRWTNPQTLRRHYVRLYGKAHTQNVGRLDLQVAAELGLDLSDNTPVEGRIVFYERQVETLTAERDHLLVEIDDLRRLAGLGPRPQPAAPAPVAINAGRPSKWKQKSDEELRVIITTSQSCSKALQRIGVKPAKTNYQRLEHEAARLGVEPPDKWGSPRKSASV